MAALFSGWTLLIVGLSATKPGHDVVISVMSFISHNIATVCWFMPRKLTYQTMKTGAACEGQSAEYSAVHGYFQERQIFTNYYIMFWREGLGPLKATNIPGS